jgi:zinc/manganese transport system substrate-binding protein
VGSEGDVHIYSPTPQDAAKVTAAKLLVINGFGLEGWLPRLLQSAGSKATIVTATQGIAPLKAGSDTDPHAWQSVVNAKDYVANIRNALAVADPPDADFFRKNAENYLAKLDALDGEVRQAVGRIPQGRRKVISTHDAFGYFAAAYGVQFIAPTGVSTESETSAREVAAIIREVKAEHIPAVFLERVSDPRLMRRISAETGAKIGGTLYSDSLTDEKGDAPTYIDLVKHNIKALTSALAN